MKAVAMLMAGGQGERMRHSLGPIPKPLVPIRGVPLLERNLIALLARGWRDIAVSVPASIPEIGYFVRSRGHDLARVFKAELAVFEERQPLGNIGVAGQLRDTADTVLVVYADNLTTLNVQDMVDDHYRTGAALTLATHHEPFRIPFGEVRVVDGRVVGYLEKPVHRVLICSGLAVLGVEALIGMPTGRPTEMSTLAETLIERGEKVRAFAHTAPWIDVNDAAAVERAEALVACEKAFESWAPQPDAYVADILLRSSKGVLLQQDVGTSHSMPTAWNLPSCRMETEGCLHAQAARDLLARLGSPEIIPRLLASFDDIDTASGLILRHYVYTWEVEGVPVSLQAGKMAWVPEAGIDFERAPRGVMRALAALRSGS